MRAWLSVGLTAALVALLATSAEAHRSVATVEWFTGNDAPSWSPDGTWIAFTAFRAGRAGEIYVMRPNGTGQKNLTKAAGYDDLAAWSPDARRIAFTSNRAGDNEIYVMNANGSGQRRLTRTDGADYGPSWSPDGTKIVFWSNRDGDSEIYVMNADGSGASQLTDNVVSDHSPDWGPDGRILFVSNRGTGNRTTINVMNADGSGQRRLTGPGTLWNESRPSWSPDGSKIAFVSERDFPVDNTEIYEMTPEGEGHTRITRSLRRDDWPTWSPDGKRLAFAHGRLLSPEIYGINIDGSGVRLLSRRDPVFETVSLAAADPAAGRPFTATLGISTGTGASVEKALPFCMAAVGTQKLTLLARRFAASKTRCTWRVPRSARGQWITATIGARLGASFVSESFRAPVY